MRNLMEKQLSWLALLVTAFYSLLASCRSQECEPERLTKCWRPLTKITNNDFNLVKNKEELERLCPDFEAGMKCITTYALDCLQEEDQRERFHSLYAGTNKMLMELCQDGPYQDEFLRYAPCMHKVQPEYELCFKKYQGITHDIEMENRNMSADGVLKTLCCGFKEFLDCSHHTVRRQCGDNAAEFAKDFINRMSNSILQQHCAPFTDEICAIGSGASGYSRAQGMVVLLALAALARYFT